MYTYAELAERARELMEIQKCLTLVHRVRSERSDWTLEQWISFLKEDEG